jgi:hypothetical protein
MIDVDHFKKINDEHGHDAGDAVLKGLVSVVRSRARQTDLLFRMGGEEFVLLLPDTTETEAMTLADDVREAIATSPLLEGHKVTVSIGVGPRIRGIPSTRGSRARTPPCTWRRSPAGTAWPGGARWADGRSARGRAPRRPDRRPAAAEMDAGHARRPSDQHRPRQRRPLRLPDGTSLLLDAGDGGNPPPRGTAPRPDGSRPTAEWIARYVRALGVSAIDYGYLTHFHDDHMNAIRGRRRRVSPSRRCSTGMAGLRLSAPDHRELQAPAFRRYREWINRGGVQGARLRPGRNDQIVLAKDAKAFPGFEVRNVAANGEVWTGRARRRASCSAAGRLRPRGLAHREHVQPGPAPALRRVRLLLGRRHARPAPAGLSGLAGRGDGGRACGGTGGVAILDHHGNRDSTNATLVSTLPPRAWIIPVWSRTIRDTTSSNACIDRLYPGPRDVFATTCSTRTARDRPAARPPPQRAGPHRHPGRPAALRTR